MGNYEGHAKLVIIIECVLFCIWLALLGFLFYAIGYLPGIYIIFIVLILLLEAGQIAWIYYANRNESIHGLIAWYVFHAILFTFYAIAELLKLLVYGGDYGLFSVIIFLIYSVYRVYSIHVIRSRANDIISQMSQPVRHYNI